MSGNSITIRRCAVYTRKSSEEGLEQDFNSLHAQREACESYIQSQGGEGWRLVKTAYDDGGLSGGTTDRPALQRLLADIRAQQVDVVVVYKVDRLTRSLMDFAKIVEEFDQHGVSFVAVTQQFNTTTSMGRLTLNVLLSFAQFEREVTAERIRDKIAASKRKGMWMGGNLPLGYDVQHRKLVVNDDEARTVRLIYERYLELGCVRLLQQDLEQRGIRSKVRVSKVGRQSGGKPFSRGALYTLLANPIYVGDIRHKSLRYEGQHNAILDRSLWESVQQNLREQGGAVKRKTRNRSSAPLGGKLFDESGEPLIPSHTVKQRRKYRYYVSRKLTTGSGKDAGSAWRLPAPEIEAAVAREVAAALREPPTIAELAEAAGQHRAEPMVFQRIKAVATQLNNDDTRMEALGTIVHRVVIHPERLSIEISVAGCFGDPAVGQTKLIKRDASLRLRRRGVEAKLVIGDVEREPTSPDPALVKLVARPLNWWETLSGLKGISLEEMAARVKLPERYFSKLLQLAFVDPSIVEDIVAGRHPCHLGRQSLIDIAALPPSWRAQKDLLGWTK